ncbi:hypothetical protein PSAC2689_60215 [Paraburkholderia sacchari]|uniref:hypothetical protein n=1 Tax=Paraburkholderia sacchari TaxID=159450 RepID=UPI0039A711D6
MNGFRGPMENGDCLVLVATLRSRVLHLPVLPDGRDPLHADILLFIDLLEEIIPRQPYLWAHTVMARSLAKQGNLLSALEQIEALLNICGASKKLELMLDAPLARWLR